MAHHAEHFDLDEKFDFSSAVKKKIFTILILGLVFAVIGLIMLIMGGNDSHGAHGLNGMASDALAYSGGAAGTEHGGHAHAVTWVTRVKVNFWINSVYFVGLSLIGAFFIAIQYVAMAGWSAGLRRIPEAIFKFLPFAAVMLVITFAVSYHDIFHWTDSSLYDKNSPNFDAIIAGKAGFLNMPFYITRSVIYLGVWILFTFLMQKQFNKEEYNLDPSKPNKQFFTLVKMSAGFIVFFGLSTSMAAWDWVMSIDTHWFSTMFGWYNFASWWVGGLATITLTVVYLKEAGYLKFVNEAHLHDLGKFVFGFSIFWTYIWFSQFLLIYYANISEETVYFIDRLSSDKYAKFIFINLIFNFIFPFFGLMTRDAKRKMRILKLVCIAVIIGHWLDFYQMIMPGTLKDQGGFGFFEIGIFLIFAASFAYVIAMNLAKLPLIPKNHPLIKESLNHHH
ncbi:MAG: quinol:cytochrome C oxidoreductase [Cytophagales bacterium]|nr:MAG: quinol:cytochrome C oxidoreductase [Cytophagales bacterium]TAF60493.1 MAG: quinol:cytochrome C oxidoreductase [Cytophagales bacterium]